MVILVVDDVVVEAIYSPYPPNSPVRRVPDHVAYRGDVTQGPIRHTRSWIPANARVLVWGGRIGVEPVPPLRGMCLTTLPATPGEE